MSNEEFESAAIDAWLTPTGDEAHPCGPDMEYENEFLDLASAAAGKPETQFAPGEPPNWRDVREKAADLLGKSRDLRAAILWARAVTHLQGFAGFSSGLRLLHGLMAAFPEHLHPLPDPDDGDTYARSNALAALPTSDGWLGDLRQCALCNVRGLGDLRFRAIEVALNPSVAREAESVLGRDQIGQMLASAASQDPDLPARLQTARERLEGFGRLLTEQLGAAGAPDLRPLSALVKAAQGLLPASVDATEPSSDAPGDASVDAGQSSSQGAAAGLSGRVRSREEASLAIDMICDYLERAEPSNPAQLLLRRARRMLNNNFLQLVKELAPDALNEVARVMGVNPEDVTLSNGDT